MVKTNVRVRVNQLAHEEPDLAERSEKLVDDLGRLCLWFWRGRGRCVWCRSAAYLSDEWDKSVVSVNGGTPGYVGAGAAHSAGRGRAIGDIVVIATLWSS